MASEYSGFTNDIVADTYRGEKRQMPPYERPQPSTKRRAVDALKGLHSLGYGYGEILQDSGCSRTFLGSIYNETGIRPTYKESAPVAPCAPGAPGQEDGEGEAGEEEAGEEEAGEEEAGEEETGKVGDEGEAGEGVENNEQNASDWETDESPSKSLSRDVQSSEPSPAQTSTTQTSHAEVRTPPHTTSPLPPPSTSPMPPPSGPPPSCKLLGLQRRIKEMDEKIRQGQQQRQTLAMRCEQQLLLVEKQQEELEAALKQMREANEAVVGLEVERTGLERELEQEMKDD